MNIRIAVDRAVCELHGQCVERAPGIFRFDDDGALAHETAVDGALEPDARDAQFLCPTQAIELSS